MTFNSITWASGIWRVENRAMNESSRLSDVFLDWATVLEMALVNWTVVLNFIHRWALLDLPSTIEDGSCDVDGGCGATSGPTLGAPSSLSPGILLSFNIPPVVRIFSRLFCLFFYTKKRNFFFFFGRCTGLNAIGHAPDLGSGRSGRFEVSSSSWSLSGGGWWSGIKGDRPVPIDVTTAEWHTWDTKW